MLEKSFSRQKLLTLLLSFCLPLQAYTLKEAVEHAMVTSPDMLIATHHRDVVNKQLRGAYGGYLPRVDLEAGWGREYSNNATTRGPEFIGGDFGTQNLYRNEFSVSAVQPIFDGGGIYHDIQGHKARVRAESWRVNGTAQDLALNIAEIFLEINLRKHLVKLVTQQVGAHEKIHGRVYRRDQSGVGRQVDLSQATSRLAVSRSNLMAERANLEDAKTRFRRKVGIEVPQVLELPPKPVNFPKSEEQAIAIALQTNPIYLASQEDVLVTKEAYKGAKSPFVPRVNLEVGYSHNYNQDGALGVNEDLLAMLRVRWNLFSGGRDVAHLCESAYQMQAAREVQNRAYRQVIEAVRLAWSTYITAEQQLVFFKERLGAGQNILRGYSKQFDIGQRSLIDVLDAQNELFAAQTAYAGGKRAVSLGIYRVMNAMGVLTDYLNAPLPVQAEPRATGALDGAHRIFPKTTPLFE